MKNTLAKGTLYLMIAQFTVMLSGYLIHIGLARLLGPSVYGDFGIILSLILITRTIFLMGTNKAVSKYIAEKKAKTESIIKSGIKIQAAAAIICLVIFMLFARNLAQLFNDPSLTNLIRLSSIVIASLAAYTLFSRGYLNGKRMFKQQAIIEIIHSVLKILLAFILVYLGFGVIGAITSYALAPLIGFFIILVILKANPTKQSFNVKTLIKFAIPIALFYAIISLSMDLGLWAVKRLLTDSALTGFYTSANTLAKVPYSIFSALTFTIFPSFSFATAQNNQKLIKKYINQTLRYTLMALLPIAILISIYAKNIINLLYSNQFSQAISTLSILVFGFVFFSFFIILCSFISASNRPYQSMILAIITLAATFVANYLLIPTLALNGAALATTLAAGIGAIIASIYVFAKFKALINFISVIRILIASIALFLISNYLNFNFVLSSIILLAIYFFILLITKEINQKDKKLILSIIKR